MLVAIKCPICGGEVKLSSDMKMGECEYCGSPVVVPQNMEKIGNLYNLATFYRQNNEFDRAIETYQDILKEDSEEAEAYFGLAMSKYGIEFVEDPKSHKRIPTFHRTKEKSILADPDYRKAVEHADPGCRSYYQEQGEKIAEIQNEILKRANAESSFDVFICYKESDEFGSRTEESVIGQELYYELEKLGVRTFFARLTLKPGEEYEPVIFSALRTARVMLVIGCNPQNYSSVWVKNEWSRFLELREQDHGKVIIPCYKNCSAYELPRELAAFQALDMNKIGFLQDVVSGIMKIVRVETKTERNAESESQIDRLCKNARTFYDLGQKEKAEQIYRELTDNYPDDYRGWWGFAWVKTNQFQTYSREIYSEVKGNAENAIKVASGHDKEEIEQIWNQYSKLRNQRESARRRQEQEALYRQYEQQLIHLKKKKETYEQKYQAQEQKLPGLYQERKMRQEMLQNLKNSMKDNQGSAVKDKFVRTGTGLGIGVAAILFIGHLLSNIGYLSFGLVFSGLLSSAILGAVVGGILCGIGGVLGGAANTKNNIVQKDLTGKYNKINAELQQINQEIAAIEPGKKEHEETCSSIRNLERDLEILRKKLNQPMEQ